MSELQPIPVVIGTAGHIDHGKSALIEALTGTHPDRWEEEQRRGITLDLGYAQTSFPDGLELGFVDVPGHERLVRKMVAGATGMGAAMLVVACDDGVMLQTREHFEVLQLLGISHGVVVLSKADLADAEMRALVRAEVEELLRGSAWQGAPILEVSAHSGEGLAELREELRRLAVRARRGADLHHPFRLPIQRAFALHGAGTVVTGVTAAGEVHESDEVVIWPAGRTSRVRRVQVHGREAPVGVAGLRTALNLPEVEPQDCPRGAVVGAPGAAAHGRLLRAWLRQVAGAPPLQHGAPVQVLAGTAAVSGRVFLPPGETAQEWLADFELEEDLVLVPGERLLVRRPSPAVNQAAGRFLTFAAHRLRKRDEEERAALLRVAASLDDPVALALRFLELSSSAGGSARELAARLCWTLDATERTLEQACVRGEARALGGGRCVSVGRAGALAQEVAALVAQFRARHPHRLRIPLLVLRERLGKDKARTLEGLDDGELAALGLQRRAGPEWLLSGVTPDPALQEQAEGVLRQLRHGGLHPAAGASLAAGAGVKEEELPRLLEFLIDRGDVVAAGEGLAFSREAVEELRRAVVAQFQDGGIDIPALRDRFQTSRKFLMPLLEYLDERGVTVRRGPNRILKDAGAPLV